MSNIDAVFAQTKLRYLIPVFVITQAAALFAGLSVVNVNPYSLLATTQDAVVTLFVFAATFLVIWLIWCRYYEPREVFGQAPSRMETLKLFVLGVPLVAVSLALLYAVFYPLSFIWPEFVSYWVLEVPDLVARPGAPNAIVTNLLMLTLLVVAAPVVEELVFRGFLFGRLQAKYGTAWAVWVSSILFGILHADIFGAVLFGVIVCLVRIKYGTLIAPMLVHAGNNAVVFLLVGADALFISEPPERTLAEFYSYLWAAPVAALIGAPWLWRYYRNELSRVRWRRADT